MQIYHLLLPKLDESVEDCEDRFGFVKDERAGTLRAAVADGAAATAFSGDWAQLLVAAYCERPFADWNDFATRSKAAASDWASAVYSQVRPWHAILRAQGGGAAAIAGIEVNIREPKWTAMALGDSCVFHVRRGQIDSVLPPMTLAEFGNHPNLISTDAGRNNGLAQYFESATGTYECGDWFLLATDAASEAFLRCAALGEVIDDWLNALAEPNGVGRIFFDRLREKRIMRDDDVALIAIAM